MTVRRTLLIAVILAILIPAYIIFTRQSEEVAQQQQEFDTLQVYRVEIGDVQSVVEAIGDVTAINDIELAFRASGRVEELYIRNGDFVLGGSILAVLDNDMQELAYQQSFYNVNRAELAQYDLVTVDNDELEVADANLQVAWTGVGNAANSISNEDIAAAETNYQELLEYAQYMQTQASQAPGGYFSDNYTNLSAQAGQASFEAEIARLQIDQMKEQRQPGVNAAYGRVLQAQAQLEQLMAGPNEFDLQRTNLQIEQANVNLNHALEDYANTYLIAPFDGVVSRMGIERGSIVSRGSSVLQLTDVGNLQVTIQVDEIDLTRVEVGLGAVISSEALPGVLMDGVLTRIAPRSRNVDGVIVFDVDVDVNDPSALLRVGMSVDASIVIDETSNVISIPTNYIRTDRATGNTTVTILNADGTTEVRPISVGLRGEEFTEVNGGLVPGDLIVVERIITNGASLFGG